MKGEFDFFIEWGVWSNLDSLTEYSLILLYGHIFLEKVLELALDRLGVKDPENQSFNSKVIRLRNLLKESSKKESIIQALTELNRLRNKLAHEFKFDIKNGELEKWSDEVHNKFDGEKYTKFTARTRIVHSFSFLAKAILASSKV
ncbi:hypothetical protein [Algoriphagus algorifonticola]|uniref:hypothetical protein n=1 Tax=Algoriphagus algorifonticola TaxID=2593007 RepID=UPI0011A4EA86|nr:hypothetical protein [Algoriphagus algorifonticola]